MSRVAWRDLHFFFEIQLRFRCGRCKMLLIILLFVVWRKSPASVWSRSWIVLVPEPRSWIVLVLCSIPSENNSTILCETVDAETCLGDKSGSGPPDRFALMLSNNVEDAKNITQSV